LITYAIAHYEEVPRIVEYMDKFGMDSDKTTFGKLSMDRIHDTLTFFTFFLKNINDNPEIAATYVRQAEDQLLSLKKQIDSVLDFKKTSKVPQKVREPKLTKVSLEDTIKASDSIVTKTAHALRVSSSNNPKRKKT
jgi:hypothetical protein